MKMHLLLLLVGLLVQGTATAKSGTNNLMYSYAELGFVDVGGNGGDAFRVGGSHRFHKNWLVVGGATLLTGNNSDETVSDVGAGYVLNYKKNFDLVSTFRFVKDSGAGENGYAFSAGVRRLLAPQFEVRGSINHLSIANGDTYLELGGDYYFSDRLSAGASLQLAGDSDTFMIGARWFFR